MALEQEVLKLLTVEGAELVLDFLDPLRVTPVARAGNPLIWTKSPGNPGTNLKTAVKRVLWAMKNSQPTARV